MSIPFATFPYEDDISDLFGHIKRPVAVIEFYAKQSKIWHQVSMIVDSGADYSLLPGSLAKRLGVSLEKECRVAFTSGVGGHERVFILPEIKVRIGQCERTIPVGFLERDNIPPLFGRYKFLDTFSVTFSKFKTSFSIDR